MARLERCLIIEEVESPILGKPQRRVSVMRVAQGNRLIRTDIDGSIESDPVNLLLSVQYRAFFVKHAHADEDAANVLLIHLHW
jgi:hypothetical protein